MKTRTINLEGTYDYYFQQDPRLGSGMRTVLVHSRTKKFIQLLDLARLINTRLRTDEFDNAKRKRRLDISYLSVGNRIAVNLVKCSQYQLRHSPALARAILQEISCSTDLRTYPSG